MTDDERRARLAARHALAPAFHVESPEAVTRAMTVLHSTEAATVHLSCRARTAAFEVADLDRALYTDRSLVKQLAMRRTLFVFPRDLLPAAWAGASARVARQERARMCKEIVQTGIAHDGEDWLDRAAAEVLAVLAEAPEGRSAQEMRAAVPMIDVTARTPAGATFSASSVLLYLGARGLLVRGENTARWYASRPRWTLTRHWLGAIPTPWSAAEGYREIVRRWLHTFGPGTEDDLVWWSGATKTIIRAALAELGAVPVSLDGGGTGLLLPDDLAEASEPDPWVALLPPLDPTVMGWRHRDFYLGPHRERLFDNRGNAGTTAWADGRIVGCWIQDDAGVVAVRLSEQVAARTRRALEAEAARLTAWLGGRRLGTGYRSPAMAAE
ncbi:hypothetical protein FHR81_004564 [Actinoalloteichus hoggarensis]|uniref:winged helix DNA-binding domain-containing protein n=1 Tax=Actinoalloteichus hoggarensis TaxID=1470176 RepID=UPI00182F4253|nr:winged helix DNA-binding domain-containing protein [Actinoalloteichus hoggarensis]MBB5923493.1 hypothetical protein [Actinoalloteichus hoggarensis]